MIVRIATEGQYRLADDQLPRLQELDGAVTAASESGDSERFELRFAELLAFVRGGEPLGDAQLSSSDAILPPPDVSLTEVTREFSAEGLIPS
ncbi:MAG: PspA-associated protein PspAA [Solirubrobacteraceae bacterium]